jgi:two-component system sensor histidine kinase RegB
MWLAFVGTAAAIAFLATRFVRLLERRDAEMAQLRDRAARQTRAESLATAVAGTAHELSSPLATVAVAAHELEAALRRRADALDLVDDAKLIRSQVDRCRVILNQMAGRFAGPSGEGPTSTTVERVIASSLARLDDNANRVHVNVPGGLDVIWPVQAIEMALLNLVRNALQASPSSVSITVASAGSEIRISVTDSGAGMREGTLSRAGEPFFTTRADGMGLGLFVSRSTVESLGGRLLLESNVGIGTTATVILPVSVTASADR